MNIRAVFFDEAPPESGLSAGSAPALFASFAPGGDFPPGRVHRVVNLFDRGFDPMRRERPAIDLLNGRVGTKKSLPGVEEDGSDVFQGHWQVVRLSQVTASPGRRR